MKKVLKKIGNAISPFIRKVASFIRTEFRMVIGICVVFFLIIAVFLPNQKSQTQPQQTTTPTRQGWAMQSGDYTNNRWFGDGIKQIKDAETDAQASDALAIWLDKIKRDPILLAAAANQFLGKNITNDSLVNNGWSTDSAIQSAMEIEIAIGKSGIRVSDAPVNGYNTGINNNTVITSPGVSGDRKAVEVTLPNQEKIWVLGRCGNLVLPGKPSLPPGKTDNPTTPTPAQTEEAPIPVPTQTVTPMIVTIITTPEPEPVPTPTTTPASSHRHGGSRSYTQPKDLDVEDYKSPGDDGKNGSGTGARDPRPTVTTQPLSTPTPVQVSTPEGDNNNKPGSSSKGTTAPEASKGGSSSGSSGKRSVPAPAAPSSNGNSGNVNSGNPANPF